MLGTALFVFAVVSSCGLVESRRTPDPRCVFRPCPPGKACRVFTRCPNPIVCNLVAECVDPPAMGHPSVCDIGDPILIEMRSGVRDTRCGPRLHCPDGTYCNNRLQDTYSTCCLSDPTAPVKPGECPSNVYPFGQRNCFSTCNNDGDCPYTRKCCPRGCGFSCVPPQQNRNPNENSNN